MPPMDSRKRKRGDHRQDSYDGRGPRQSPYRPEESQYAQHGRRQAQNGYQGPPGPSQHESQHGGRGGRRGPRGGRGGSHHTQQPNALQHNSRPVESAKNAEDKTTNAAPPADSQRAIVSSPAPPPSQTQPTAPPEPTATPNQSQTQTYIPPPLPIELHEPPPNSDPPTPYDYTIITEDRLKKWQESGRAAVVSSAVDAFTSEDSFDGELAFQEILHGGIDARIEALDAGRLVKDILSGLPSEKYEETASLFLDEMAIMFPDKEEKLPNNKLKPPSPNLRARAILLSTDIPADMMRGHLDAELLIAAGMVRNNFVGKYVRYQTHLLYKQSNYNLLREESEGYSKLTTTLFTTTSNQPPTAQVIEDTFENMKALIGAFDLDAGRVLDVTLDVFANLLVKHFRFFVRLLRQSSWWPKEQSFATSLADTQGFTSLPLWAHPGYPSWQTLDEDVARISAMKLQRDRRFWDRATNVGMQAFFELGDRHLVDDQARDEVLKAVAKDGGDEAAEYTRQWINDTKTLPPPGNPVAAQLLGFKLEFYTSAARDSKDELPVNLIFLAALLIKIGFISLRDLYPYIWPSDDAMSDLKEKRMKEKAERELARRPGGGALNALARAGALVDDTAPPPGVSRLRDQVNTRATTPSRVDDAATTAKPDETSTEKLPEPKDQKIELLKSLLCLGAIPEALYLLGRFPWLMDGYPELVEYIHRILHYSLAKVYEPVCPMTQRDGLRQASRYPAQEQAGVVKGELLLQDAPPPKVLKWAHPDRKDQAGTDYEFYWQDWTDHVPVCQTVDDVFTLCSTFLNLSGVKIGQDPTLIMKLARIGRQSLREDASSSNRSRWLELCKRLLVPALSLTGCNPGVVNEMYDLLKFFDTPTRYSVYSEWFLGPTSRLPDIASAFDQASAETKDTMKRMSKTNMKPMARQLAKVACASPGVVFQAVFRQIESYNNLIDVVVECGRYFTYMSYDVLTWTLLTALGKAGRERISQNTGTTLSLWLLSLSQFTGRVFKRYSVMNSSPILQYIQAQLQEDNFADLYVLREMCVTMGGIAPDTDFTEAQVQAMAGGELLQAQTLKQVLDKRHESRASGRRLTKTLVDHDLAGSMLIAIAQQRQKVVFSSKQNQVKVVAENFDGVHIVLQQFLDLLRHNLSIKDFNDLVPDVASLIQDYGIEPSVAFMIHRKGIAKAIEDYDAAHAPTKKKRSSNTLVNGDDLTAKAATARKVIAAKDGEDEIMTDVNGDAAEASGSEEALKNDDEKNKPVKATDSEEPETSISMSVWHPVLQELMDKLKTALPEDLVESMSLPFFVSFWQLSVNDLTLPTQSYTDEDKRQNEKIKEITTDRTDPSTSGARRRESEKKQIRELMASFMDEMKVRIVKHAQLRTRLEKEKAEWFTGFVGRTSGASLVNSLLQECFLPRMVMSPLDSYFSWKMLNLMHSSGAPGFKTMLFIDALLNEKRLSNVMFQCTGREAENLGRFLYELLRELGSWHADKTEYEKKAYGPKRTLPGFLVKKVVKTVVVEELLGFEQFRTLLYKWHTNIKKATASCINSGEYMHMKNAIVVLKGIGRVYPVVNWMGHQLCEALRPYTVAPRDGGQEEREDVRVLSNSLYGMMKSKEKQWCIVQAFRTGGASEESSKQQNTSKTSVSQAPKSPQPTTSPSVTDNKTLDARAPDFTPTAGQAQTTPASAPKANNAVPQDNASPQTTSTALSANPKPENAQAQLAAMREKLNASRRQSQPADSATRPDATTLQQTPASSLPPKPEVSRRDAQDANAQTPPHGPARTDADRSRGAADQTPGRDDQHPPRGRYDRDAPAPHGRPSSSVQSRYEVHGGRVNGVGPSSRHEGPARFRDGPPSVRHGSGRDQYDSRHDGNDRRPHTEDRFSRPPPARVEETTPASAVQNSGHLVDPARARLMAEQDAQKATPVQTPEADRRTPGGRGSRPQSPTRSGGPHNGRPSERDYDPHYDAPSRPPLQDSRSGPPTREHAPDHAPNGPRGSAATRQPYSTESNARNEDAMRPPPSRPDRDRAGGRFSDTSRPQRGHQDESFGRLNSDSGFPSSPAQSPPAARRGPDMNGASMQPHHDRRSGHNYQSGMPPVSPAKDRMQQPRQPPAQSPSLSQTPAVDRPSSAAPETTGVHPSRLAQLGQLPGASVGRPPPIQTQPIQSHAPAMASPVSAQPPSGPRSATQRGPDIPLNSPSGPRGGAPSGPAGRRESGPGDRRFAGLQDAVAGRGTPSSSRVGPPSGPGTPTAQSGDQGISIRGGANGPPASQQAPASNPAELIFNGRRAASQTQSQLAEPQHERHRDLRERDDRDTRDHRSAADTGRGSHRSSREASRNPDLRERERDTRRGHERDEAHNREQVQGQGAGRSIRDALPAERERDRDDRRNYRDSRGPGNGRERDEGRDRRHEERLNDGGSGRKRAYELGREGRGNVEVGGSMKRRRGGPRG